jgi:tyrosinase
MSPAAGMVIRPSVEQADTAALRDAYGKMQAFSAHDNRSWIYWAEFHGFNRYDCWHHSTTGAGQETDHPQQYPYNLFLPWHRAYLHAFDNAVRDHNPDAIQPWWDWTSSRSAKIGAPAAYTQATVDGKPNPLASGPTPEMPDDPARRTRRFPQDPAQLPSWTKSKHEKGTRLLAIEDLLALKSFTDFSAQLENIHDFVHPWAGGVDPHDKDVFGDMGMIPVAAFDPLFYAHHTMIDRLWYLWQLQHGLNNIPSAYLNKVLAPFNVTVAQVLDLTALGYEYAGSTATASPSRAGSTGSG